MCLISIPDVGIKTVNWFYDHSHQMGEGQQNYKYTFMFIYLGKRKYVYILNCNRAVQCTCLIALESNILETERKETTRYCNKAYFAREYFFYKS